MNFQNFKIDRIGIFIAVFTACTVFAYAQSNAPSVKENNLYCGGFIQSSPINTKFEIVGGEFEADQHIYSQGDNLVINAGASDGLKVGDMFSVVRPRGRVETRWTKKDNLGFLVQEVGAVEIVMVKNDISIALVKMSCDGFLLGDLLLPMPQRVNPLIENRPEIDVFGDSSGKVSGRIVLARDGHEMLSKEQIVYIDLGAEDNVKAGDFLTIYRPLGTGNIYDKVVDESVSARDEGFQSNEYRGGKFSNQAARKKGERARGKVVTTENAKSRRPGYIRRVVGEMVILNVKEKTATAMITRTTQEVHTGDFVELQ